ncbi:hypothetical protein ACFFUT_12505 [Pseudohalocynthiibacter aestuariivivens]|jgi:hypothetical protein|uniref:Uncharacterized protein n=1 Tax=Pseudohalocynthiibacter aestuariivivens TaxID=1591409 RepID=A0ABV5JIT3_9RHOB|nr:MULTISPECIES: hypothetical protein [Pseudohalocynthiibacter]MBS9718956.1 hypothetical protein [Pseudohalocynthiibacter aestuariivivens]MCK0103554.1 hypothetical protein [Pseudohalocynthiibacter sp. F2068]
MKTRSRSPKKAKNERAFPIRIRVKVPEDGHEQVSYKVYETKDEFLADYPNCCAFSYRGAEGYLPSHGGRFRFGYKGIVSIDAGFRRIQGDEIVVEEVHAPVDLHMNSSEEVIPKRPGIKIRSKDDPT